MTTKVFGESNNLIVLEGDIDGLYSRMVVDKPAVLIFDDKTVLRVCYNIEGVWKIWAERKGYGYRTTKECDINDSVDDYSDIVTLENVFKCYLVTEWTEFGEYKTIIPEPPAPPPPRIIREGVGIGESKVSTLIGKIIQYFR